MGYAGQPMKVVKANRALLQKRNTFKKVKEMFLKSANSTALEFKKVSPEKLTQIKAEIRRKAKVDAWKEAGIYLLCTAVVFLGLYWLIYI
ncbi:hypothetical protein [Maribacter sp. 2308TA10-17]|uniref:hypothetical protein n=1 Tax=Maribacter sp. 2308TA10-17 TaxID=3386276 RepID=UPI0039BC4804